MEGSKLDASEALSKMEYYKERGEAFEKKYKMSFEEFEKRVNTSKEENFGEWDDYIDWGAYKSAFRELKKEYEELLARP